MPRKTNDELNTDVNALAKQWTEFLKIAPTKADLNNLATKEDVKKVVQTELATFKEEMQQTLKEDVETRFSAFTKEQDVKTNNINTRVDELERKLENKLAEVDVKTVLQDMYTRRMNYLLLGAKEKQGTWKETNKECLEIVQKYLALMIPDPDKIHIIDCHRLGKKSNEVNSHGEPLCRPIIFKVRDMFEVRIIRDNLKNLSTFFKDNPSENKVHFRRHLPQKMYKQRQQLQPKFTELFRAGDEPKWELDMATAKFHIVDKHGNIIMN